MKSYFESQNMNPGHTNSNPEDLFFTSRQPGQSHFFTPASNKVIQQQHEVKTGAENKNEPEKEHKTNPQDGSKRAVYEQKIKEGSEKLMELGFENPSTTKKYNTNHWTLEPAGSENKGDKLVLRSGVQPSVAIRYFFEQPQQCDLDCARFIQVVTLWAELETIKDQAFDQKYQTLEFIIRAHESTGVVQGKLYERFPTEDNGADKWYIVSESGQRYADQKNRKTKDFLNESPTGTRVGFTVFGAGPADRLDYENTIKVGNDLYSNHGVAQKLKLKSNIFTEASLKSALADLYFSEAFGKTKEEFIKNNIFITTFQSVNYKLFKD